MKFILNKTCLSQLPTYKQKISCELMFLRIVEG